MDSGVAGLEAPSACASLHALACFSFLSLFLAAASFAVSFFLFAASSHRRLAWHSSGTGGFETYPLWLTPCKRDQIRIKE